MQDKLTRGFVAGIIGGIAANIWSFFSGAIGFTKLRFVDWASIIIYAHTPPFSFGETLWALLIQLGYTGGLGIIFIYLISKVTTRNLLFKGWLFAEAIWFLTYAITTLFKVDGAIPIALPTAISDFISSAVFGLVQAKALQMLPYNADALSRMVAVPAMKFYKNKPDDQKDNDDDLENK